MADTKSGGKGNKKKGRASRKPSHTRYTQSHQRERNKIKRVFRSSGLKAAEEYSKKHGVNLPGNWVAKSGKAVE